MHLNDSFYVALCMTILICGVVYWFWTQNQYVLRKLHLLNNIVFEMRTQMNREESAPDSFAKPVDYPPAPSSVLGEDEDLLHETLAREIEEQEKRDEREEQEEHEEQERHKDSSEPMITPFEAFDGNEGTPLETIAETLDDLQPGGAHTSKMIPIQTGSNVLEGMTLKELRRLGEQRGVSGAASMKKAQLLSALRETPNTVVEPFEATVRLD